MKNLIALTGLAGSGKTTAADYLVNAHGFICIKFRRSAQVDVA